MIKINNVSKAYVVNKKILNGFSLEIKRGEIFGLLGPNGAGKTTLLKMITGVHSIDEGNILVNDIDVTLNPLEAKKNIGYVPDNPDIFLRLKGIEYLLFMAKIYGVFDDKIYDKINNFAARFEIIDDLNKKIIDYSHGMRQKIVLIGALISNPKVWILDEPLTGLDPKAAFTLKEMMKEHALNGNTVLFSTHVLEVAEKLVDRIGIIKKGELVFVGTINELKEKYQANDESLEEVFLEIIE